MAETGVTARVEGIANAIRTLRNLEQKARRRVVSASVRAGVNVMKATAMGMTPIKTGTLRRSVRASMNMDRRTGTVTGKVAAGKVTKSQAKKGLTAYYAHMVHGGTKPHVITARHGALGTPQGPRTTAQHPGARANPWMERAGGASFAAAIKAFTDAFAAKMQEEINKS